MFQLIALICVLDSSPRGHHCDPVVFDQKFETIVECRKEKNWLRFHKLPSEKKKMVMGDCIFKSKTNVF